MTGISTKAAGTNRSWRIVDIVVASVIAVAFGVIFWAWCQGCQRHPTARPLPARSRPASGVWLIPAVLGGLIIRKPGAALYCETVAAVISALLGGQCGRHGLISRAWCRASARSWCSPPSATARSGCRPRCWPVPARGCSRPDRLLRAVGRGTSPTMPGDKLAVRQLHHRLRRRHRRALSWLATRALARTGALERLRIAQGGHRARQPPDAARSRRAGRRRAGILQRGWGWRHAGPRRLGGRGRSTCGSRRGSGCCCSGRPGPARARCSPRWPGCCPRTPASRRAPSRSTGSTRARPANGSASSSRTRRPSW